MKSLLLLLSLFVCGKCSIAQSSSVLQIWMKGDNSHAQPGIYGTKGLADPSTKPGSRDYSSTWRDINGNLWLFGGHGYDHNGDAGNLNDLWKYTPATNTWTWINGDNVVDAQGVYGNKGIAAAGNTPGASHSNVAWTDNEGNFWLFAGLGNSGDDFGFLNDLWKYDPSANLWTWISGDNLVNQQGIYGTQGIANSLNHPGARYGAVTWNDSGTIYLFGGFGIDASGEMGMLNDLWKWNSNNHQWTWINGNDAANDYGNYGQQNVPASANTPGARYVSVAWKDNLGNLVLFGGYGNDDNNEGILNDLWKYNPSTNVWKWMKGDHDTGKPANYGTRGVAHASNKPGARYVSVSWTDAAGDAWIFGGYGHDRTSTGYLNDLWKYNATSNEWVWVKGDDLINQYGIYGVQGMPTAENKSGARTSGVSWTDGSGNLWLFGGYGYSEANQGVLNDLWKISSMQVLPVKLIYFNGVANDRSKILQWETTNEENFRHFNVQRSNDYLNFSNVATVNGKGLNTCNLYEFTDTDPASIGNEKIYYRLELVDDDNRISYSRTIMFEPNKKQQQLSLFPNPAANVINLSFTQEYNGPAVTSITDINGVVVNKQSFKLPAGRASIDYDITELPAGSYFIRVANSSKTIVEKFLKL